MITIFTDGSSRGNPGPGGWGAIIANDAFVKEIGGGDKQTTNNRMELTAVIKALEYISKPDSGMKLEKIILHTDSEYIVKGITTWIHGWQANNWRTAAKKPVMNQDLWQKLLQEMEGKEIEWVVVKGHAGVEANERCDEIATIFADASHHKGSGDLPLLYRGPREGYKISFSPHGIYQ